MLILTNGLTDVVDEGFLKVANSLVKRIKSKAEKSTHIITYDRKSNLSDRHIEVNKLLLNKELKSIIRERNEKLLYIPFPAKPIATALRVFNLSRYAKKGLSVVITMTDGLDFFSRLLLKLSGAKIILFSEAAKNTYASVVGDERVVYLKTGVDCQQFAPLSAEEGAALKSQFGFDPGKKLVLHVGHLNEGRNIAQLEKLATEYSVLLVTSTLTQQDAALKARLEGAGVRIIDSYIPNIQQVYQMCDVYFFPVLAAGNCIDMPLSCLEAAACNKPVITTDYGEMSAFRGKSGFYFIDSFDEQSLKTLVQKALSESSSPRSAVIDYDWRNAVRTISYDLNQKRA